MYQGEYDAKRRQLRALREELEEEDWQRFLAAHPEKNLSGVTWRSLATAVKLLCPNPWNPRDFCMSRAGFFNPQVCVFCGREWEE